MGGAEDVAETMSARVRARPGGRSEQVRLAVGEATLALLAEGLLTFTIGDVAARAGVGRRTVYRWWPTQEDLLIEALATHVRAVPAALDTGSWERDLRTLAHAVAEFAADPTEVAIARIMASQLHPSFSALVEAEWEPAMASWRGIVERALARGEIRGAHTPSTVINTLLAPVFLAPLSMDRPMGSAEVDALVDLLIAACAI